MLVTNETTTVCKVLLECNAGCCYSLYTRFVSVVHGMSVSRTIDNHQTTAPIAYLVPLQLNSATRQGTMPCISLWERYQAALADGCLWLLTGSKQPS